MVSKNIKTTFFTREHLLSPLMMAATRAGGRNSIIHPTRMMLSGEAPKHISSLVSYGILHSLTKNEGGEQNDLDLPVLREAEPDVS